MRLVLALLALSLSSCIHVRAQSTETGSSTGTGASTEGPSTGAGAVCQITTTSVPAGAQGVAYTTTLASLNCPPSLTWSITAGSLPTGLSLNASTGVISGTPSSSGSSSFTVKVVGTPSTFTDIFDTALSISTSGGTGAPQLPDSSLLTWNTTVANSPSPNTLVTVGDGSISPCDQTGGTCSYATAQIGTALAAVGCGQTLELQNTVYTISGSIKLIQHCDASNWITITRDFSDATFPAEGTRVTPCYAGMPSSAFPGEPSYICASPARHMPLLQKSTGSAVIQFGSNTASDPGASFYRFIGIEFGRQTTYDLDFGILAMINTNGCTVADTNCMNHQPSHVILDRIYIDGDAQRQTTRSINLGGQWIAVIDSWLNGSKLSFAGGGGDAQGFAGGNGKFITNVGFWKMQNNYVSASTMGSLFCGSFVEPISPVTTFDGIPHDIWWTQNWFWKNPLWDTQLGQSLVETIPIEGVNYGPQGDQELVVSPTAISLQQGHSLDLNTTWLHDSAGGLNRFTDAASGGSVAVDGSAPCTFTSTHTVGTTPAGTSVVVTSAVGWSIGQPILIVGAGGSGSNYEGTVTNISGTTFTISPATSSSVVTNASVSNPDCLPFGDSTHGIIRKNTEHSIGSSPYTIANAITWKYIACSGASTPDPGCIGATTAAAHSLLFNRVVIDGRAATLGNNRTLASTVTITVTSGAPTAAIAMSPSAPDLSIQPSYPGAGTSDASGNTRQFCYLFFEAPNYTQGALTWKVDGISGGNSSVGTVQSGLTGLVTGEAVYCAGSTTGSHTVSVTDGAATGSQAINVSTSSAIWAYDLKAFTSKNCWEAKCLNKGLLNFNILENSWGSQGNGGGQGGSCALDQPINQANQTLDGNGLTVGYGPEFVSNLTADHNHCIHTGNGFVLAGLGSAKGIHFITYKHFLQEDLNCIRWGHGFQKCIFAAALQYSGNAATTTAPASSALNPVSDNIFLQHITSVGGTVATPGKSIWFSMANNNAQFQLGPFGFTDSIIVQPGSTTFKDNNGEANDCNTATGSGTGNTEAAAMQGTGYSPAKPCNSTYSLARNALVDNTAAPGNFTSIIWQPTDSDATLFGNYNSGVGGDYSVAAGGQYDAGGARDASDGTALGADVAGILASDAVVRWGAASPPTIDLLTGAALMATPARLTNHMHTSGSDTYSFINTDANYPVGYPAGLMGWVKHLTGNPWDIETYNSTYAAEHWITEDGDAADAATCVTNGFSSCFLDPNAYKRFLTPVPMLPRNFTYGTTYTIDTPGTNTFVRTTNCEAAGTNTNINLGDIRSITSGPYLMSWGGTIDAGAGVAPTATDPNFDPVNGVPTIRNDYYYGGTLSSGIFIDKESTFYPIVGGVPQGRVGWFFYKLVSGAYVLQQFTANTTLTAGAAPLNFPCGAGKPWWH